VLASQGLVALSDGRDLEDAPFFYYTGPNQLFLDVNIDIAQQAFCLSTYTISIPEL